MQNTENKFKHDGVIYVTNENVNLDCSGCAFERDNQGCGDTPNCYADGRQDNRNVIFVESDADNFGDEE